MIYIKIYKKKIHLKIQFTLENQVYKVIKILENSNRY